MNTFLMPSPIEIIGAILFVVAILHTFSTKFFEHLAKRRPAHAGLWHLLGEIEVVFGFWALILILAMCLTNGTQQATTYLESRNFTEPLFVFAIMVIAGTRPILVAATWLTHWLTKKIPLKPAQSYYFLVLSLIPLFGSFITEPAAMTLAGLMLAEHFYSRKISTRLKYATLGVLFVNISIGGTLTHFAAPPVLMVASTWGWDLPFMFMTFGWKAIIAVLINTIGITFLFRREIGRIHLAHQADAPSAPLALIATHLLFLIGVVITAHHPTIFMGLFLFFLGIAHAYQHYQDKLILREGLLVAFFLAGLVVLGEQQQWWLQPLLMTMNTTQVFFGATTLTAITDNAALTYLGSLVPNLSDAFKYALVAGAVSGGGLTIIANAPNPAGIALLRGHFKDETVNPIGLLLAALPPTMVAILAFYSL